MADARFDSYAVFILIVMKNIMYVNELTRSCSSVDTGEIIYGNKENNYGYK